jgi:hypothetical protein
MQNECLDAALRELADVGVRPTVHNDRRHVLLEWDVDGKKRQYFLPKTPSDRRAWLNCRADVRRMIKEDGLDVAYAQRPLLQKALEVPVQTTPETPDARMIRLEREHDAMIDLIIDLDTQIKNQQRPAIEIKIDGVPMVLQPAPTIVPAMPAPVRPLQKGERAPMGYLVSVMREGEWVTTRDLVERTGLPKTTVTSTLHYWKKKGVVEKEHRKWRRK